MPPFLPEEPLLVHVLSTASGPCPLPTSCHSHKGHFLLRIYLSLSLENMSEESLLKGKPRDMIVDELVYSTPCPGTSKEVQDYLIFFMTGNPGLISFYEPFLSTLRDHLSSGGYESARFHICGHSYSGFETSLTTHPPSTPLGLEEQIEDQERRLMDYVKRYQVPGKELKVILMGHSVGSYVLLELIQRHLRAVESHEDVEDFDLIGGILLFPTIADIGQSPVGRIAKLILPLPGFARFVGALARAISRVLSERAALKLVSFITRFPDYAAKTTASFLRSPSGVQQALYGSSCLSSKCHCRLTSADFSPQTKCGPSVKTNGTARCGEQRPAKERTRETPSTEILFCSGARR